jgi:hypothetical protein
MQKKALEHEPLGRWEPGRPKNRWRDELIYHLAPDRGNLKRSYTVYNVVCTESTEDIQFYVVL